MITHTDDCIRAPYYDGNEECRRLPGKIWSQPQGWYVSEARGEFENDAPWCRILHRAWELQAQDG